MEFGKKLRKLRTERGLSQQKLADLIFVSRSAVAKWESGLGLPSEESCEALSRALGVPRDTLRMETPEVVVVEKNKQIRKLSGSICAVVALAVILLAAYGLFHPVPWYVSASCEKIVVQIMAEGMSEFEITDPATVDQVIDMLNSTTFRKSLRVDAGKSAPDTMEAMLTLIRDEASAGSVILCSTPYHGSVFWVGGGRELAAVHPEALSQFLIDLLREETDGAWQLS